MKRKSFANQLRWFLSTALLGVPLTWSSAAFAQDDENSAALDRLEVTGSRIRQSQIEGFLPVQTLDREDIDRTGLTSVGDILQQLTISGSAINTRFNSSGNFGFPPDGGGIGAGATQVDLRHLNPNRVIVLVDGQRWVNGASASGVSSAVDLNTIPVNIIERIEILKDGANAIYGSDAIAGVVNIITKKDYEGAEARAYYGGYDEGDGENLEAELTVGKSGDGSSFIVSLGYADQSEVFASDRELSQFPTPFTGLTRGSSGTPQGRYVFFDPNTQQLINATLNDGVVNPTYDPANPNGGDYHGFTNNDRFNFAPLNLYITPWERTNFFAQGLVDITDNVQFYIRGLYNNRKSTNQAAPEPIFIGPGAETGGIADTIVISADNPFNPFGFNIFESQLDIDNGAFMGRRPLEAGPRVFKQDVDTFFVATGLKGEFVAGNRPWYWDANFAYGRNSAEQRKTGALNAKRIKEALGPVDACAALPGCVPLNLFGGQGSGNGTITQEMLNYISFVQNDKSENNLRDFTLNIGGDIADLPAGPLGLAFGYERRELDGFFQPDAVVVAGESNGVPSSPTRGDYDTDEFYAEFNIPVLSGNPGAELLDFSVAARYQDFSTFGSETTSKVGFRYMPNSNLLFRGTFAEGIRAPGIGELFGTQSRFDAVLADPCAVPSPSANCVALGVPSTGFEQINPQISILTGGNPNLQPEESDTLTLGFVYSPGWVDDLSWANQLDFEFTFYDIEVDGAIQALDAQTQLNGCVADPSSGLCSGIVRSPSGAISSFQNTLTNIGGIETDGWDLNIRYTSPQMDWGSLAITWDNSVVGEYVETDPITGTSRDIAGIEENDSAIADFQSNLAAVFQFRNDYRLSWRLRYIGEVTESCSDFLDGTSNSLTALGLCSNPNANEALSTNDLDATMYHDVVVNFPTWKGLEFELGANNLLGEDPPPCLSCSLNGYDPSTYDPEGRFIYARATYRLQ